ncbi:hypothetical protein DKP78_20625, partial [Enterococcus faecium]
ADVGAAAWTQPQSKGNEPPLFPSNHSQLSAKLLFYLSFMSLSAYLVCLFSMNILQLNTMQLQ